MPDTFQTQRSRAQASSLRRNILLDEWDDTGNEMHAIERAALAYLDALDARRGSSYGAKAVKLIGDHAADFAAGVLDLLSDIHGGEQKRLDNEGIDPESLTYDSGVLMAEADEWNKRAEARR